MADSVSASAARSASLKYDASRHAASVLIRASGSPAAFSSRECMSTHTLHPLIWLARSSTNVRVVAGRPPCLAAAARRCRAGMTPGRLSAGFSIRGSMMSSDHSWLWLYPL
ncbi:MAG TPA: hypothetical protein VHT27_11800 [Solirubrobacteraceae bacterium]|nr:hypothetical protein [Solirubrobacteraceae bacterium]